jgi:hypothetical protein
MVGGRAILLLAFGLASGALTACGEVIGLGEEPRRALTAEDCKLPPAQNPACTECMVDACCDKILACAADTECADKLTNCLPKCWEPECAGACLAALPDNSPLQALGKCGFACRDICQAPVGSDCRRLGEKCCRTIQNPSFAQSCEKTVQGGNAAECRKVELDFQAENICTPD